MQTRNFGEKSSVKQTHSKHNEKRRKTLKKCPQRDSIGRSRWSCPSALHEVRKRRPRGNRARFDVWRHFSPLGARNPVIDVDLHLVLTTQHASMPAQRVRSAGHGQVSRADAIGERLGLSKFDGVPGRAVKREERPRQRRGMSGALVHLGAASGAFWARRWLFSVSRARGVGQNRARGGIIWID